MHQNPYQPPAPGGDAYDPSRALEPGPTISVVDSIKFAFSGQVGLGKLAIGLVLLIIPLVGPIVLGGWMAASHRRLVRRESPAVQGFEFDEFVPYLMAGVVPFVAQMAATFVAMFPMTILGGIAAAMVIPLLAHGEASVVGLIVVGVVSTGVMFVMMALMMVVVTALQIRAELTGSFTKTFDVSGVIAMCKRQWKSIIGHSLLFGLLAMPLLLLGLVAFIIGIYFVAVGIQFGQMHLRWQIYEADLRAGGEPLPVFPGNGADI